MTPLRVALIAATYDCSVAALSPAEASPVDGEPEVEDVVLPADGDLDDVRSDGIVGQQNRGDELEPRVGL